MYQIILAQKYLESANKKALLNAITFYSFILFKFIKCYLKINVRLRHFFLCFKKSKYLDNIA